MHRCIAIYNVSMHKSTVQININELQCNKMLEVIVEALD